MNRITKLLKTQIKLGYWSGFTMAMYPSQFAYKPVEVDFKKVWQDRKEINLYYHIPFCKSICPYCGFFTTAQNDKEYIRKYFDCINEQVKEYISFFKEPPVIKSICFGGGTPNHTPADCYDSIFETLRESGAIFDELLEPSMEVAPELLTEKYIAHLEKVGLKRLSLGVQSLNLDLRETINRENSYNLMDLAQIMRKYHMSINIDVMSGIINQTADMFMDTLEKLMEFKPETISIYPVAGKNNSMFKKSENIMTNKEKYELFSRYHDYLLDQGYYCESNVKFVLKGQSSTHQQKIYEYKGVDTMGIGCAARSYNYYMHYSVEHQFNPNGRMELLHEFMENGYKNMQYYGIEINETEHKSRFAIYGIFVGSVALDEYFDRFGMYFEEDFAEQVEAVLELGLMKKEGNTLVLTKEGKVYTDIICTQFWSEDVKKLFKS